MHLKKITDTGRFHDLHNQWDSLLSSRGQTPLPLTHGWMSAWWKEFNHNRSLCILCVYNADKLVAIAPFYKESIRYRGIPAQHLHLFANGHTPYSDIIYDSSLSPEQIDQVIKLLITENNGDLTVFAKLPKTSLTYASLTNSNTYKTVIKDSLLTPTIKISGGWDTFFKSRSRKFRKSINNKLNRFKKEPDFTIDCETISSPDSPLLDEIVEVSKRSWKAGIKNDLGSNHAGRRFLLDLVETFGPGNHIQIWILRKSAIPVAFEFHVVFDRIVYPIRADYDENYKKHSPGSILEYTALRHLFEDQQVTEYYTCADNYWYLNNWSSDLKEHYTVEVFGNKLKSLALYSIENHAIPLLRKVRDKIRPQAQ